MLTTETNRPNVNTSQAFDEFLKSFIPQDIPMNNEDELDMVTVGLEEIRNKKMTFTIKVEDLVTGDTPKKSKLVLTSDSERLKFRGKVGTEDVDTEADRMQGLLFARLVEAMQAVMEEEFSGQ